MVFQKSKIAVMTALILLILGISVLVGLKHYGNSEVTKKETVYNSMNLFTIENNVVDRKMCMPVHMVETESEDTLKFEVESEFVLKYKIVGRVENDIYGVVVYVKGMVNGVEKQLGTNERRIIVFRKGTEKNGTEVLMFKSSENVIIRFSTSNDCQ